MTCFFKGINYLRDDHQVKGSTVRSRDPDGFQMDERIEDHLRFAGAAIYLIPDEHVFNRCSALFMATDTTNPDPDAFVWTTAVMREPPWVDARTVRAERCILGRVQRP